MARLDMHGVHTALDEGLKKYITKKINKLEKYVPPFARESMHIEIYIEETKTHGDKQCECEAVVHLPPKETIRIKEGTVNMYAAVDIVDEKLKQALIRYKEMHENKLQRHLQHRAKPEN